MGWPGWFLLKGKDNFPQKGGIQGNKSHEKHHIVLQNNEKKQLLQQNQKMNKMTLGPIDHIYCWTCFVLVYFL